MSIQIVFFGTGSGRPMPYRNVAGMAMVRDGETFVFDCGEYTQVQMMKTSVRPGKIDGIFISHFHGDHVNGLPGFLGSLSLNRRESHLPVFAPSGLQRWFDVMHQLHIVRVDRFASLNEIRQDGIVLSRDDFDIVAKQLDHRVPCYGYALIEHPRPGRFDIDKARSLNIPPGPLYGLLQKGKEVQLKDGRTIQPREVMGEARPGLKIVYCTDTRPCNAAIELAKNADLLIYESTYPAGMEEEAHSRGHSTSADAAKIALKANVKKLILTHLSQRFFDLNEFLLPAKNIFPATEIARDFDEFIVERSDS